MALRETDLTKQVRRRGAASQLGAHWSVRWAARGSLAAGLAQGLANAAWAEEAGPTLAPVVVTGTRLGTAVLDTPASVDVVDGAAMRRGQPGINLSEGLAGVPGLQIQNRCLLYTSPSPRD